MSFQTKLQFQIEGVEGDLDLVYTPFSVKLYQNDWEVKKKGWTAKYPVHAENGDTELLTLTKGLDFTYVATFRNKKYPLESKFSVFEYILVALPLLLMFIGGALGGAIGAIGAFAISSVIRAEKSIPVQILYSLLISGGCYGIYFVLSMLFLGIIHA
jgi:hypothetical protein